MDIVLEVSLNIRIFRAKRTEESRVFEPFKSITKKHPQIYVYPYIWFDCNVRNLSNYFSNDVSSLYDSVVASRDEFPRNYNLDS